MSRKKEVAPTLLAALYGTAIELGALSSSDLGAARPGGA